MDKPAGTVGLPAILTGIKSRADRSWSLGFDTRELTGDHASTLTGLLQAEGYLIFAPNRQSADSLDIPEIGVDAGISSKTPSQRLRAVLYVLWEQRGSQDTFEQFYHSSMERIVDSVKAKLEP